MNYSDLKLNIDIADMSYRKLQKELRHLREIGLTQIKLNSKRAVLANEYKRIMTMGSENNKSLKPTFEDQVKIFAEVIGSTANEVYQLMREPISLQETIKIISDELDINPYQLQSEIEDSFDICDLDSYLDAEDVDLHYFLREMANMTENEVIAECDARSAIIYAKIANAYGIAA